jgi:hypothetical protein
MSEMNILEWTVAFTKYKDSVKGAIQSMEQDEKAGVLNVINKDGSKYKHLCMDSLVHLDAKSLSDEKVSCLNKKENVNWLTDNWDILKDKKCIFFFVNLKKSENWAINPRMHHSVTDKSALKSGLKSLFESIPAAD